MEKRNPHLRELLALSLVDKIGAQRMRMLLRLVGHPQEIFRMSRKQLESVQGVGPVLARKIARFNGWEEVDEIMEQTSRAGADIITIRDEAYPALLREIYDPPVLLWISGNPEALQADSVAMVGTRKASSYGKQMAAFFAKELVNEGLAVISGLALGIDGEAHRSALDNGGTTVAVMGSGIDWIYPSQHRKLAADIAAAGGAVITEYPPGTKPDAGNFPIRNRIVSGMSLGTLVVESALEGGSMITAASALDQNREVFVVPHALTNKNGVGCNWLIKQGGGKPVQDVEDILNEISIHRKGTAASAHSNPKWKTLELDKLSISICELLDDNPRHIDEIVRQLDKPPNLLLSKLLELEMEECVKQESGRIFSVR